jgi:hypothetical protein
MIIKFTFDYVIGAPKKILTLVSIPESLNVDKLIVESR